LRPSESSPDPPIKAHRFLRLHNGYEEEASCC
jgi:hypothetical protein